MTALGTRAATYVRVSTEEQVDGTSLGVQRDSCRRVVEQRGWEMVGTFSVIAEYALAPRRTFGVSRPLQTVRSRRGTAAGAARSTWPAWQLRATTTACCQPARCTTGGGSLVQCRIR
jgi:hypothetical protein